MFLIMDIMYYIITVVMPIYRVKNLMYFNFFVELTTFIMLRHLFTVNLIKMYYYINK